MASGDIYASTLVDGVVTFPCGPCNASPCCLYPAHDLLSIVNPTDYLTDTILDVATSSILTKSGTTYSDGTTTITLGVTEWERNGVPYGDCLIVPGTVNDQFSTTYAVDGRYFVTPPPPAGFVDFSGLIITRDSLCRWTSHTPYSDMYGSFNVHLFYGAGASARNIDWLLGTSDETGSYATNPFLDSTLGVPPPGPTTSTGAVYNGWHVT